MWLCCWEHQPNLTLCGLLEHSLLTPTHKKYIPRNSLWSLGKINNYHFFPENYRLKHFLVCQLLLKFLNTKVSLLLNPEELSVGVPSSYSHPILHNFTLIKNYINCIIWYILPWPVLEAFNVLVQWIQPQEATRVLYSSALSVLQFQT